MSSQRVNHPAQVSAGDWAGRSASPKLPRILIYNLTASGPRANLQTNSFQTQTPATNIYHDIPATTNTHRPTNPLPPGQEAETVPSARYLPSGSGRHRAR